jgi:hypothetical protein
MKSIVLAMVAASAVFASTAGAQDRDTPLVKDQRGETAASEPQSTAADNQTAPVEVTTSDAQRLKEEQQTPSALPSSVPAEAGAAISSGATAHHSPGMTNELSGRPQEPDPPPQ